VDLNHYIRLCGVIFLVVLCTTSAMIATSFAHHLGEGWTLKVTLILAIAVVNAFLVAGYLMHLLSEKKLVYAVLGSTVVFFIGLVGLTLWAMGGFPPGTATH
jgi:caa(3)-type oxidase subunit IV